MCGASTVMGHVAAYSWERMHTHLGVHHQVGERERLPLEAMGLVVLVVLWPMERTGEHTM